MTIRRRNARTVGLLLIPVLAWVLLLLVIPQLRMLDISLRFRLPFDPVDTPAEFPPLSNYIELSKEPLYWKVFVKTIYAALPITVVSFTIAFPIAYSLAKVS